jgi:hypothetical protein
MQAGFLVHAANLPSPDRSVAFIAHMPDNSVHTFRFYANCGKYIPPLH